MAGSKTVVAAIGADVSPLILVGDQLRHGELPPRSRWRARLFHATARTIHWRRGVRKKALACNHMVNGKKNGKTKHDSRGRYTSIDRGWRETVFSGLKHNGGDGE